LVNVGVSRLRRHLTGLPAGFASRPNVRHADTVVASTFGICVYLRESAAEKGEDLESVKSVVCLLNVDDKDLAD
jgi:hypothetical protein